MKFKETIYGRNTTLRKNSNGTLPSQNDWDRDYAAFLSANAMYVSSKAKVQEAKFAFEATQYDLDKTVIYSPIDGVVLTRNIDPGQTVAAAFQTPILFKLANDLSQMELHVSIDEADIAQIKRDQHVFFSVDAYPDTHFYARVKSIRVNSEMVAGVVTYKALLWVDNQDHRLLPGMSADANIVTKHIESAWIVPRAAILFTPVDTTKKVSFGPQNTEKLDIDMQPHVWVKRADEIKKIYVEVQGTSGAKIAVRSADLKRDDKLILSQEQQ
jgi:HlyD family secretion protein